MFQDQWKHRPHPFLIGVFTENYWLLLKYCRSVDKPCRACGWGTKWLAVLSAHYRPTKLWTNKVEIARGPQSLYFRRHISLHKVRSALFLPTTLWSLLWHRWQKGWIFIFTASSCVPQWGLLFNMVLLHLQWLPNGGKGTRTPSFHCYFCSQLHWSQSVFLWQHWMCASEAASHN